MPASNDNRGSDRPCYEYESTTEIPEQNGNATARYQGQLAGFAVVPGDTRIRQDQNKPSRR